jgi:hypothetical protein
MLKYLLYDGHKQFHVGHKKVENDLCNGHPSTSKNEVFLACARDHEK